MGPKWSFSEYDFRFSRQAKHKTCHYFLKIVEMSQQSMLDSAEWRPALRPLNLGETCGVVWMPLSNKSDEFPCNMRMSLTLLGETHPHGNFIHHAVVWAFCTQYIANGTTIQFSLDELEDTPYKRDVTSLMESFQHLVSVAAGRVAPSSDDTMTQGVSASRSWTSVVQQKP